MTSDQSSLDSSKQLTKRLNINFALQAAGLGVWEVDPVTNQVIWDDRCRQLFGLAKDNHLPYEQAIQYIHPDDMMRVDQAVAWALNPQSGGSYDQTYRTIGADDKQLRWVRFQGEASFSPTGELLRFAGIAQDVTPQILLEQSQQQVLTLFEQSPVGIAVLSKEDLTFQMANPFYGNLAGRTPEQLLGKPLLEALPELVGQGFDQLLREVIRTGEPYVNREASVVVRRGEHLETIYIDHTYQPQRDANGQTTGVLVVVVDVTQQVATRQQIHNIIQQTPAPTLVLRGDDYCINQINQPMLTFMGRGDEVLGQPLLAIMPELAGQFAWQQVQRVYQEGIDFEQTELLVPHVRNGILQHIYYDVSYRPLREAGTIIGVIQVAIEVTEQVKNHLRLKENEAKLRAILDNARAGIGVYVGPNMVIENPNQIFIDILGKGPSIAGKPLREVLPEFVTEGQPFLAILDEVYRTGIGYATTDALVKIFRDGKTTNNYYNFSYTPVPDQAGKTYQIVVVAIDVTEQVLVRQALEESEATLRGAIEVADMGTWELNMNTGRTTYSTRLRNLFELTQDYIEPN